MEFWILYNATSIFFFKAFQMDDKVTNTKLTEEKGMYLKTNLLCLQHVYILKLYLVNRNKRPSSQIYEISADQLSKKLFPLKDMS